MGVWSWGCVVCRQLYHVLQHQACTSPKRGGVIIACNKSDLEERAFSQDFISRQLEKEMCASGQFSLSSSGKINTLLILMDAWCLWI